MPWKWRTRWTPKSAAEHPPPHRLPASTGLTIVIVLIVLLAVLALVRWYSR
jgi:hypothetical protein